MAIAEVYVTLKPTLLDVQGATVLKSLHQLGHTHASDVRIGKYITVTFDDALTGDQIQTHVDAMCRELLANPVIEDYRISIGGVSVGGSAVGVRGPAQGAAPVLISDEVPSPQPLRATTTATGSIPAQVTAPHISAPQSVAATPAAPAPTAAQVFAQPVAGSAVVTSAPAEVALSTAAAVTAGTNTDPFAMSYESYNGLTADEKLALQGRAWQQHGAWIESELAARRATWILCAGQEVIESGQTLDSYPTDAQLELVGTTRDLVPLVFTRAPQS
jgi:phosphoribosylformylglycinamidine synthase